jgi:recombination protein RecT
LNQQSTAVATRQAGQNGDMTAAEKEAPLPVAVRHELEQRADALALSLPGHMKPGEFVNMTVMAIAGDPEIMQCTKRSIVTAAMKAAADGLMPDKREGAFIAFNVKVSKKGEPDRWQKQCQWMPMVYGVIKKIRQSGDVKSLTAHVAYENDHFDYELGDNERLEHKPVMQNRGRALCAYAIAKLENGEIVREIVSLDDLNKIKAASKNSNRGPWVDWWDEMARKSAIKRLAKYLPMSKELEGVIRHDDEMYDLTRDLSEGRRPVTNEQIRQQAAGALPAPAIDPGEVTDVEPDEDEAPSVFCLLDANGVVTFETEDPAAWVQAYCAALEALDGTFLDGVAYMQANIDVPMDIIANGRVEGARDTMLAAQNAMRDRLKAADAERRTEQQDTQQQADDTPGYEDGDPGPGGEQANPWKVDFPATPKSSSALMPALTLAKKKLDECRTPADLRAFNQANRAALSGGMAKNLGPAQEILADLDRRLAE